MSINFSSNYDWHDKTILIAEDEDFNFIFLEEILIDTSVTLIRVSNGEEAVSKYTDANNSIDLILMDMQMPILNGYEATRIIKEQNNEVPIIAQTAYHYGDAYEEIFEAGCDNYITKPIDINELREMISKYFD
ncbi:MAG: response regulator [Marinifilaceae bacterium]|jgi:CheY-like chemotaxis protein|nr:response regulator [Marinifilaceae bacterium]